MKFVIQRVLNAEVSVEDKVVSSIGPGLLVFVGMTKDDDETKLVPAAYKLSQWRLFEGPTGKPDFSLLDKKYELLLISQFTLCADLSKGRRPDFTDAMNPEDAHWLYQQLGIELSKSGVKVAMGAFGKHMQINSCNDGPFTIVWEV